MSFTGVSILPAYIPALLKFIKRLRDRHYTQTNIEIMSATWVHNHNTLMTAARIINFRNLVCQKFRAI